MDDPKKNQKGENRPSAQNERDWGAHFLRIWMGIYGALKICIGAVVTVVLIVLVCGFVMASSLGDYLETDILPNAGLVLENYDMDSPSYVYFVNESGQIEELQKIHASTDWKNAEYDGELFLGNAGQKFCDVCRFNCAENGPKSGKLLAPAWMTSIK